MQVSSPDTLEKSVFSRSGKTDGHIGLCESVRRTGEKRRLRIQSVVV